MNPAASSFDLHLRLQSWRFSSLYEGGKDGVGKTAVGSTRLPSEQAASRPLRVPQSGRPALPRRTTSEAAITVDRRVADYRSCTSASAPLPWPYTNSTESHWPGSVL
jgi:hypothetical protein